MSQFWKQFFEASANVSLSGYEELVDGGETSPAEETAHDQEEEQTTAIHDHTQEPSQYTPRPQTSAGGHDTTTLSSVDDQSSVLYDRSRAAQQQPAQLQHHDDSSVLTDRDGDLAGSTPHAPPRGIKIEQQQQPQPAGDEMDIDMDEEDSELIFQQHTTRLLGETSRYYDDNHGFEQGEEEEEEEEGGGGGEVGDDSVLGARSRSKNPVLHRMQNKTYRIMATPHKGISAVKPNTTSNRGVSPVRWKIQPTTPKIKQEDTEKKRPLWEDSPSSSPEPTPPQLRSAAFMSPMRLAYGGPKTSEKLQAAAKAIAAPRTPGVSVQTPAVGRKTKDVFGGVGMQSATKAIVDAKAAAKEKRKSILEEITWESDEDLGVSPPKTIQFAVPASRLMQTPGESLLWFK